MADNIVKTLEDNFTKTYNDKKWEVTRNSY